MLQNMLIQVLNLIKSMFSFLINRTLGRITLIASVIAIFQSLGLLTPLITNISNFFSSLITSLGSLHYGVPVFYWLVILIFMVAILWWLLRESLYLQLVSGSFRDDFNKDLGNWEFGGEGWKTEKDENKPVLSVSQSGDGGITKKGFSWCDYEFSFDCKIINKNVGWLIRAENRNKYLMVQLNMEDLTNQKLRLHLRIPPNKSWSFSWIVMQEDNVRLDKPLKLYDWINTKIVVLGSNIDIYLNNQHVAHYFIADPIRWQEKFKNINEGDMKLSNDDYMASINYTSGKVGFRCDRDEHAHIRNVRVKPLW